MTKKSIYLYIVCLALLIQEVSATGPNFRPLKVEAMSMSLDDAILNSSNGKTCVGATIDSSRALADFDSLTPGGISEEIVWRFKAPTNEREFPKLKRKIFPNLKRKIIAKIRPAGAVEGLQSTCGAAENRTSSVVGKQILVGANVQVSRYLDHVPHFEPHIAVNPNDPKHLVAVSIRSRIVRHGKPMRLPFPQNLVAYVSKDGGATWAHSALPGQESTHQGLDPFVVFGKDGAVVLTFTQQNSRDVKEEFAFYSQTSMDGGFTWNDPVRLPGYLGDRQQMAVDMTDGPYRGRIYVAGNLDSIEGVLQTSDDNGRTWSKPKDLGDALNAQPLVFGDGTLFLATRQWKDISRDGVLYSYSISKDGGNTLSDPRSIGRSMARFIGVFALGGETGPYADRIYRVWSELMPGEYSSHGRTRILSSYSADRGISWSPAVTVDPGLPDGAWQFRPEVSVNRDGVVGISWIDTRRSFLWTGNEPSDPAAIYNLYFTASLDGGKSFLAPVRVSSEDSHPLAAGNTARIVLQNGIWRERTEDPNFKQLIFTTQVNMGKWGSGGEYMGLVADGDGVFHALWSDGRSSTFQLYTAGIHVRPLRSQPQIQEKTVTSTVELVFERSSFDAATQTYTFATRLRNLDSRPIYPPIKVAITEMKPNRSYKGSETLIFANASNGRPAVGAMYDYSKALGDLKELPPGAITNVIEWQVRGLKVIPYAAPQYPVYKVTACVEKAP